MKEFRDMNGEDVLIGKETRFRIDQGKLFEDLKAGRRDLIDGTAEMCPETLI